MSSEKKHYAKHINKKFIWLFANIAVALIGVGTSSTPVHAAEKATGADRQSSTTQTKNSNTSSNSSETFSDQSDDQLDDTSNPNSVRPFIFAHDTTIVAGPDAKWNPADNIDSATDSEGQPITVADMTIVGSVDPTKIGVYSVTYDYTDPTTGDSAHSTVTVHVIGIQTKDTTLTADPDAKWDPADNFISATGSDGKPLNLSDLTVSGNIDPTKPGRELILLLTVMAISVQTAKNTVQVQQQLLPS